ncbi:excinuclease ABC subunit UvrC [Pleionea sp. CnH1-48]|uniref:excinuclease ABC subunit UvrC n=1 Tax=Pleionea sp. CnH1-48 TaxID=2954494 RepID=UPI002096C30A|nr:excinuclease ABC subunit UvrC [Pleionea sp. CnH1-48]MCO7222736.1 excinuclease ABC subunit UvrC [Pleionea sp. CnH1-48]
MSNQESSAFDIKAFLKQLTELPGVYRMINAAGEIIYVGKAKNLKKRVSSYFTRADNTPKTRVMVSQIERIEVTVTNTETEALLLENNLIKKLKPRYNVVFRDDKSYPYVYLSKEDYPRLAYHRGARKKPGDYFGPFPGAMAVKNSLSLLQKLFRVRQCEDSVFKNRSRPCLQYQIKRCTAPCVNYISKEEYAQDVELTRLFYQGKNEAVIDVLKARMDHASETLEFEQAAYFRDLIASLRKLTEKQVISGGRRNLDVFSFAIKAGIAGVVVLFIRQGKVLGSKSYFPKFPKHATEAELIDSFIMQFYMAGREVPEEIVLSHDYEGIPLLQATLSDFADKKVKVSNNVRSERADWVRLANSNVEQAVMSKLNLQTGQLDKIKQLQKALDLDEVPNRMECFDISHTMGEGTVASCVVFDQGAPAKSLYRRFNIEDVEAGDDYAAIKQAVSRRYARLLKEDQSLPDLILIDGGKGQLNKALDALGELGLSNVQCIGVSKGSDRKAGQELIHRPEQEHPSIMAADSLALHLIQHIRDEAHRFAITAHRQRRGKARTRSWLEEIPGIGPKKRRELLRHFGGLQGVERATHEELCKVAGINRDLAQKIVDYLSD